MPPPPLPRRGGPREDKFSSSMYPPTSQTTHHSATDQRGAQPAVERTHPAERTHPGTTPHVSHEIGAGERGPSHHMYGRRAITPTNCKSEYALYDIYLDM